METTLTSPYLSFILRLWQAGDDEQPQWCTALIDPQTGERRGFASLEVMTVFLQARMDAAGCPKADDKNHTPECSRPRAETPIRGVWSFPYLAVCCR